MQQTSPRRRCWALGLGTVAMVAAACDGDERTWTLVTPTGTGTGVGGTGGTGGAEPPHAVVTHAAPPVDASTRIDAAEGGWPSLFVHEQRLLAFVQDRDGDPQGETKVRGAPWGTTPLGAPITVAA